jgi:lysophospholipase L1-like esterase
MVAGPGHACAGEHEIHAAVAEIGRAQGRRRLRRGLLVSLFTLAGLTLAAELCLRLSDQRERSLAASVTRTNRRWVELTRAGLFEELADPVRRYAMRPGAEARVDGWLFRVSSQRARGPDLPRPPAPGREKRLLCLGDSFAFGLWCDESETLVARLAQLASARESELGSGISWRGIDLGVPGYHLGQSLRAFEQEGLELEPDLVVLYCNTNDIERSGFYFDEALGVLRRDFLPLPVGLKRALWRWSHLYGWIASRHARAVESGPRPHLDARVPYAHVRADNQAYARAALARLAELCRARGIPLFVVHQPLMTYLGDTRRGDWEILPLVAWLEGVRAELGLPGLSLLGWLRGYSDGVDRMAGLAPDATPPAPDFIPDTYFADEEVQAALAWAREKCRAAGRELEQLSFEEQLACFAGYPGRIPEQPDFHLTGAGYQHVARVVYTALRAQGLLP